MAYGTVNVTVVGNVGKAEIRKVPTATGEKEVLEFSVAVNRKIIGKGAGKDANGFDLAKTEWYKVKSWSAAHAKLLGYLTPGLLVCVSGEQEQFEFDKRDGGGRGMSVEIRPSTITLLGSKKREDGGYAEEASSAPLSPAKTETYPEGSEDGELPF